MDISEVIRRWQAGNSRRHIASGTGLSKDTVGRYISAAEASEMSREGPAPTEEQLSRLAAIGRSGPRLHLRPGQGAPSQGQAQLQAAPNNHYDGCVSTKTE